MRLEGDVNDSISNEYFVEVTNDNKIFLFSTERDLSSLLNLSIPSNQVAPVTHYSFIALLKMKD